MYFQTINLILLINFKKVIKIEKYFYSYKILKILISL